MSRRYEWLEENSNEIVRTANNIWDGRRETLSSGWPRWSVLLRFEHDNKDYSLYYKDLWAFTAEHAYRRALGKAVTSLVKRQVH